jgi:ribosome maturation factor RimP
MGNMKETNKLHALLEPSVTGLGYELWGCVFLSQGQHSMLRVYIDSEHGINVDDCERVSRQISAVLDVEDPVMGSYTLEVSSPGLDRPLFKLEHFQRFIGSRVELHLHTGLNKQKHFKGILVEVIEDNIVLAIAGEKIVIALDNIVKAKILPEINIGRREKRS